LFAAIDERHLPVKIQPEQAGAEAERTLLVGGSKAGCR